MKERKNANTSKRAVRPTKRPSAAKRPSTKKSNASVTPTIGGKRAKSRAVRGTAVAERYRTTAITPEVHQREINLDDELAVPLKAALIPLAVLLFAIIGLLSTVFALVRWIKGLG